MTAATSSATASAEPGAAAGPERPPGQRPTPHEQDTPRPPFDRQAFLDELDDVLEEAVYIFNPQRSDVAKALGAVERLLVAHGLLDAQ